MKPVSLVVAAVGLTCLFSHCAHLRPKKEPETPKKSDDTKPQKPPEPPKLVGRIASVPQDKSFVLIQSYGKWNVPVGAILTTRGPDKRTANLLATGESLGEFAAADVQSGTLDVGDGVYTVHIPKPQEAETPSQPPESTQKDDSGNVQKNN